MATEELRALEIDDDEGTLDRSLRQVLEPLLGFAKGRDVIILKDGFNILPEDRKVVAYHLGRLALNRLRGNALEASTETVASETQILKKSCGEYHSRLKAQQLLDKNQRGWFVPPYSILRAAEFVAQRSNSRN